MLYIRRGVVNHFLFPGTMTTSVMTAFAFLEQIFFRKHHSASIKIEIFAFNRFICIFQAIPLIHEDTLEGLTYRT